MSLIPEKVYFKIGEVSDITGIKPYVLRYWESQFKVLKPDKSHGKQRVYKKIDIENVLIIKKLLYDEKLTFEGVKKKLSGSKIKEVKKIYKEQQMDLPFMDKNYKEVLETIHKELIDISKEI